MVVDFSPYKNKKFNSKFKFPSYNYTTKCKKCKNKFKVDESELKDAVCDKCGGAMYQREDDKAENVQVRLDTYKEVTEPLIKYYADKGTLILINGESELESTTEVALKFAEGKEG